MMLRLQDKRTLITGGASGIGAATARRYIDEGARVVILDRDTAACEKMKEQLSGLVGAIIADVSDFNEVERAFGEMDTLMQGVDIVINNAGISIRHGFLDITMDEWQQVMDINLNGVFYVAQHAARRMTEAGSGVIINMASTNGLMGYPYYADYNASKAGVLALTRTMALELAPHVRVLAVCPGYVLTPMQEAEYSPEMLDEVNRKIPLGRHAAPDEVASLFVFLASEEASYLTGHCYVIDGGEIVGGLASR
jgi:meso-butanediol dehydrogenase/(S,S)-butanediol dehydrogenase/diacetyl reductase